jgi:hypothetical protein
VVHTGGSRRRGKPRSRILYWFRTPPGVRVGRAALDEEAIRLIEEHNPDVQFDWIRILKGQETTPSAPAPHKERREKERPPREPVAVPKSSPEESRPPLAVVETPPSTVSEARLGPEGLARLRARHAALLARISQGIQDPVRRDELKSQAERLNPDTWVTDAEVAAALESYEAVFESLRTAVGQRRKRRRSRKQRPEHELPGTPTDNADDADEPNGTPEPEAG